MKTWTKILCGFGLTLVFGLGGTAYAVYDYVSKCPKIEPKENIVVSQNSIIYPEDVADISHYTEARIIAYWQDDNSNDDLYPTDDRRGIIIGNRSGVLLVTLRATGEVAESRDAKFYVTVE